MTKGEEILWRALLRIRRLLLGLLIGVGETNCGWNPTGRNEWGIYENGMQRGGGGQPKPCWSGGGSRTKAELAQYDFERESGYRKISKSDLTITLPLLITFI